MPLGLFSQKMKLRAPFPISEGERPGEETRRESSYDETGRTISEKKWANDEGTGDIWYETGVLIFPVWGTTNDHKEVGLPVLQDSALPPIYLVRPDD